MFIVHKMIERLLHYWRRYHERKQFKCLVRYAVAMKRNIAAQDVILELAGTKWHIGYDIMSRACYYSA